mgnify:CR=1 FL=1
MRVQLAIGISEALVNTALGLTTAIIGIMLYNYFATRVDNFQSSIEETSFEVDGSPAARQSRRAIMAPTEGGQ